MVVHKFGSPISMSVRDIVYVILNYAKNRTPVIRAMSIPPSNHSEIGFQLM